MKLWRSVVGKLWMTILLLVSFVLFFLTILLLEFFENYHTNEVERGLSETAVKISKILSDHENKKTGMEVAWELVDEPVHVIIAENKKTFHYSPNDPEEDRLKRSEVVNNPVLSSVFTDKKRVKAELEVDESGRGNRHENSIAIAVPLEMNKGEAGAVIIYQSLEVIKETSHQTTKLILLAAGIAIFLTTIFAFFLSTRITAPLRKMREAANELTKGNFDTTVPILTTDEIGALATSFNQMARQLNHNIHALNQEKEQLASILSSMADGVITFNRDGTILITNPPAERFLQNWYYEVGKDHPQQMMPSLVEELLKEAVQTETEKIGEFSVQGRSYVIIVSPLYNGKTVRGAVAVVRDMTEERRLDKLRKDFLANVSHELRTPISMLQGYSEAIIDDIAATEDEKREMARIIYDESLRIGRLVNELLDLARMEAGHISLNMEEVDFPSFIRRVTDKFQGVAKEKDIDLTWQIPDEKIVTKLDPDRIEQVLTNLIDNALRHTPEHGFVKVSYELKTDGHHVSVQDSGAGISEEDLPFVFERFYKGDKARTRGRSGTGLGLSIAKNIISAHSGSIKVQSKLGEGTIFSFRLPAE
ncbi:ATP-binding protein [Pseudobacillus badius]|uniref:ATP-binding protein n=1 Tax=Bacillus badius TaxID=1455 RepID=UPI0007B04308|nr:ATP-binding protein [Bacillus badius]KZN98936.1 PAS domain-containing sensor histidine kinase [Bacillus badius]MED0664867.1 ATP-binding protein [Bacillus badius]OCS83872.1 PAS domain-containing sensor histidine kinase [Bacillus badius]OVE52836.1 PAS domain-containing sensor histidine kinase [Bacillus badius]UAT29292.1 HAMP domain-containing protein [Bacillus badius]